MFHVNMNYKIPFIGVRMSGNEDALGIMFVNGADVLGLAHEGYM